MARPAGEELANHEIIEDLRLLRGFTKSEAAARAQISLPYWSEIERGIKRPSQTTLRAIADVLGVRHTSLLPRVVVKKAPACVG